METEPPVYTRHPKYWEEETRTFVYAVESTLYHLPLAILTRMSLPLTAIFGIPPSDPGVDKNGKPLPAEGTEKRPIVIPGVTVRQMDDFLSYFFRSAEQLSPERTEEVAMNLLTVGSLWDIDEARAHGKSLLEGLPLSNVRILKLVQQFGIHEWVAKPVKELIPLAGKLDGWDTLSLGPTTLCILYTAKSLIDRERLSVAYSPPKLPESDKLDYGTCWNDKSWEQVWKENWWPLVGRKILHPDKPMKLSELAHHVRNLSLPGMTFKCHEDAVTALAINTWEFDGVVEGAVKGILDYHKACRLT
ncbi:hypothetical protein B0H16DRAFT_1736161 [Mycena metata]|uniref:Uncharacterized protein n=1 Tax=Mycena metata TaxID=1033252 RepID=A0AAD7MPP8_9AGAR|nr:hypothetical protein B0H16DRAFT_1736161 [Mycena metata]